MQKREETLRSGLSLVEIDYLHERRPVLERIPSYPDRHPKATPYTIVVSDPRPTIQQGLTRGYGFGVLEALPVVGIPLEGEDKTQVNFNAAYQKTFDSRQEYYDIRSDCSSKPVNMGAYSPADCVKMRLHMQQIAEQ